MHRRSSIPAAFSFFLASVLTVTAGVSSISIVNPSFQTDIYAVFPGYAEQNGGQITGWAGTGNYGINGPDGSTYPFSDGTTVDGSRLAFIHQNGSLSQTISGLVSGQRYVFQGWFRGRSGIDVPTYNVSLGSQALLTNQTAAPGGPWQPMMSAFIAEASSGLIHISSSVSPSLDGTLAVDGIMLFQQSSDCVNIWNPSFESGTSTSFPGYESTIAGWTTTGTTGLNFAGNNTFSQTGGTPDGTNVAFIQGNGSMSQTLIGLTPGQQYLFEMDANSRLNAPQGRLQVKLGGSTLIDTVIDAADGTDPFRHLTLPWTAGGNSAVLEIIAIQNGGDTAIAFDNLSLRAVPEPTSTITGVLGFLLTTRRRRRR